MTCSHVFAYCIKHKLS